jgi:GxxExxY protein
MPIKSNISVRHLTEDEFHRRDYAVMGLAFGAHKELGRMCDEDVYREFLRLGCVAAGFGSAATEVQVVLWHEDFRKRLYIDLVVDQGIIYELKTLAHLEGEHQMQLLNYLLLTGIQHGKLVNFRPSSVEYRFVSTRLTWGVFLEAGYYAEALTHFLGGENAVIHRIEIIDGLNLLGCQRFHLIDKDVAFRITAVSHDVPRYQAHLKRLLCHTRLKAIQWVNLNLHNVTLRTVTCG